jgi:hypothetical protein
MYTALSRNGRFTEGLLQCHFDACLTHGNVSLIRAQPRLPIYKCVNLLAGLQSKPPPFIEYDKYRFCLPLVFIKADFVDFRIYASPTKRRIETDVMKMY